MKKKTKIIYSSPEAAKNLLGRILMAFEVLNRTLSLYIGLHPLDLVLQTLDNIVVVFGDEMLESLLTNIWVLGFGVMLKIEQLINTLLHFCISAPKAVAFLCTWSM